MKKAWANHFLAKALLSVIFITATVPAIANTDVGANRQDLNNVIDNVVSGQNVTLTVGSVEGFGISSGTTDVVVTAHGWQRVVDSSAAEKVFVPMATASELSSFVTSGVASSFNFDFLRQADSVTVNYADGASNPAHVATGQTLSRTINIPAARLDSRSGAAFDAARILRFTDITINMERNDCRQPIDYITGLPVPGSPANICEAVSWVERPTLILTYRPVIRYGQQDLRDADIIDANVRAAARDFSSRIISHTWEVTWETDTSLIPPIAEPDGPGCGSLTNGETEWRTVSTGNSAVRVGVAAQQATPHTCTNGIESATENWDRQREFICYDGNMFPLDSFRRTNVTWNNVVCVATPPTEDCPMHHAKAPNGVCVNVQGTDSLTIPLGRGSPGYVFSPFIGVNVDANEGSAMHFCASNGRAVMHDFGGDIYGRKKPGKSCGKSDTYHANYVFSGNKNDVTSMMNLGNYGINWSDSSDTNCMGYMRVALCSGPNYLVPTVQMLAQNVTDPAQATPPAGMAECPAGLNIIGGNPYSDSNYFASASGWWPDGNHQARTASSFMPTNYPVTVLAKQQLNCYQRQEYQAPQYDYNAPPEQWITDTYCDYYGCYTTSTPPQVGTTSYYSLATITTQLFCREVPVYAPTGNIVENCNNTGLQGHEWTSYTASPNGVCGTSTTPVLSCVPISGGTGGSGGGSSGSGSSGSGNLGDNQFIDRSAD